MRDSVINLVKEQGVDLESLLKVIPNCESEVIRYGFRHRKIEFKDGTHILVIWDLIS